MRIQGTVQLYDGSSYSFETLYRDVLAARRVFKHAFGIELADEETANDYAGEFMAAVVYVASQRLGHTSDGFDAWYSSVAEVTQAPLDESPTS